ncbi:hypothetical protein AAFN85_11265 [Mucilaginibacter sp. CAU 1740]|uniref:hypothetical protein n=1 Tax=Mucilaginibacter sp. CAU 1740 TaxID=3140365 RepID=UPI00325B12F8
MILTADELKWIDDRLKIYDIQYREIYDEIADHIITAIEEKRKAGDTSEIKYLFQEVVDKHFDGYQGIEKLAASQESTYKQTVQSLWVQSIKYYLNWPALVLTVIAVLLSLQLPNVKIVRGLMLAMCVVLAFLPVIYAYTALPGSLRYLKGKKSLLRDHFITKAAVPAMFLNLVIYLPHGFALMSEKGDNWQLFNHILPPLGMLIVMAFVILNLATIRFCREFLAKSLIVT